MRKILLLLSCIAVMFSAAAAEQSTTVVFATASSDPQTLDNSTPSVVFSQGADFIKSISDAANVYAPAVHGLKMSSSKKKGVITLNLNETLNLTKIVVKASNWYSPDTKKYDSASLNVNNTGAQNLTDVMADYTYTVTGEHSAITLEATKRLYVESITFYYDQEGPVVVTPKTPTFSLAGNAATEDVTVTLICETEGAKIYYTLDGTTPTAESTEYAAPVVVKYEDGTVTVKAVAVLDGVLSSVASETITRPDNVYTSLADLLKGTPLPASGNSDTFLVNCDLTVTYANARNIYVYADGVYSYIYANAAIADIKAGDIIKGGWLAHVSNYNSLYEIVPETGAELIVEGTATLPTPESFSTYTITENDINKMVILENVVFEAETETDKSGNFKGKMGDAEVQFHNTFKVDTVKAGTYNVTAIVSTYNNNIQLLPISYSVSTGVAEVEASEEAEYYTFHGVKVANPEAGLYIVKRGNKVFKAVIK